MHHPCSATDAQHSLWHPRQHAAHGDQAVFILLDAPASRSEVSPERSHISKDLCIQGSAAGGVCGSMPYQGLRAYGSLDLDAIVVQPGIEASLELFKGHSWPRNQGSLLQEQPRVREGHGVQERR